MVGFYRTFCKNFAHMALSFTVLLIKDGKFAWGDKSQKSFEELKEMLCNVVLGC